MREFVNPDAAVREDNSTPFLEAEPADWQTQLDIVVEMMREISRQTDPQELVRTYRQRIQKIRPTDGMISLSRRGMEPPFYRITRSTRWQEEPNPWKQQGLLPVLKGGLLSELIYGDQPRLIGDLQCAADDPAAEYMEGMRSLIALPLYDQGAALNMVILLRKPAGAFSPRRLPEYVWMGNLFGRATQSLVLSEQLKDAYEKVDREMRSIAGIQRFLLPRDLPSLQTLDLAAHYQTSSLAGGDYYDCFPLSDGRLGLLIADVSGHGTPAAVMMAITHAIAHSHEEPPRTPAGMLTHLNRHLATRYAAGGAFVTAFYGIFDPRDRSIHYSSAGHHPPRIKRCDDGSLSLLDGAQELPLGIDSATVYPEQTRTLVRGDQVIFYTDGITDACDPQGAMFGFDRLDAALHHCRIDAGDIITAILQSLEAFTQGEPAMDDRTILVAKIK